MIEIGKCRERRHSCLPCIPSLSFVGRLDLSVGPNCHQFAGMHSEPMRKLSIKMLHRGVVSKLDFMNVTVRKLYPYLEQRRGLSGLSSGALLSCLLRFFIGHTELLGEHFPTRYYHSARPAGGPAFAMGCFVFPITESGCPIVGFLARVGGEAADTIGLVMPRGWRRYYGADPLHFITCSCYRRMPLLGSAGSRDRILSVLEPTRKRSKWWDMS